MEKERKALSKRAKELKEMAQRVQKILKKHNVKPFDRKEISQETEAFLLNSQKNASAIFSKYL